jgi:hypothetical protein
MTGEKLRRGMAFGGFALLLGIGVVPLALNVVWTGPVPQAVSAILWLVIAALAAFGFYLGFSGWGRSQDY